MSMAKNGCQSEVTDLHLPLVSINKYVITFQIPMYNRWVMTMQVEKTTQNLPRPILQSSYVYMLMFLSVPTRQIQALYWTANALIIIRSQDETIEKKKDTNWRKFPEVNTSVMKLMLSFFVSTHEL